MGLSIIVGVSFFLAVVYFGVAVEAVDEFVHETAHAHVVLLNRCEFLEVDVLEFVLVAALLLQLRYFVAQCLNALCVVLLHLAQLLLLLLQLLLLLGEFQEFKFLFLGVVLKFGDFTSLLLLLLVEFRVASFEFVLLIAFLDVVVAEFVGLLLDLLDVFEKLVGTHLLLLRLQLQLEDHDGCVIVELLLQQVLGLSF